MNKTIVKIEQEMYYELGTDLIIAATKKVSEKIKIIHLEKNKNHYNLTLKADYEDIELLKDVVYSYLVSLVNLYDIDPKFFLEKRLELVKEFR